MATTEQQFYELLARIDHPVFRRDFSTETTANSPFNSIWNRIVAKQLVKLNAAIAGLQANSFPNTCDENTIDRWEQTYLGYTQATLSLPDRIDAVLKVYLQTFTMNEAAVLAFAQAITGQTPIIKRNLQRRGWVLGQAALGVDTVLSGSDSNAGTYMVIFSEPVDSVLLAQLDSQLTIVEKGGSRHILVTP